MSKAYKTGTCKYPRFQNSFQIINESVNKMRKSRLYNYVTNNAT